MNRIYITISILLILKVASLGANTSLLHSINTSNRLLPLFSWYFIELSLKENYPKLPEIEFYNLNTKESLKTRLYNSQGLIPQKVLDQFEWFLRDHIHNKTHPIEPRLLKLIYKIAFHFNAKKVIIISGYRYGKKWKRVKGKEYMASRHHWGKAIDFFIPEVNTSKLAAYARTLGKVGVGYYPNSNFIHLDVREGSYFWVNKSRPGRKGLNIPLQRNWVLNVENEFTPEYDLPWIEADKELLTQAENIRFDKKLFAFQKKKYQYKKNNKNKK